MNFLPVTFAATAISLHGQPVSLPEVLKLNDGTPVTTAAQWNEKRRAEVLELFRANVYGRTPVGRPESLRFAAETTPGMMDGKATRKLVTISYSGPGGEGKINLILFVPHTGKPAPCLLFINNRERDLIDPTRAKKDPFWPAEQIVARGYAAAAFWNGDVAADDKVKFYDGAPKVFGDPVPRRPDGWGAMGAWAWGASRAMDYLETDKDINAKRVAVVGHSRGGKTALWAGAQDERFALTISNNSGSGGAALSRGKVGEHVKEITKNFPFWFCENYKKYVDRESDLPLDQHMLLALVAPRLLYVASASEDSWADPEAEYFSAVAASPVYQLFGLQGLPNTPLPKPESPLHTSAIGHHIRTGKHDLTEYDWARFMDFADGKWK